MDIKEYIASGILEQYVLGKLSAREEAEVEKNAERHPELRQELDAIERALEEYALLHGKMPPPGVLSAILQRLHAGRQLPGPAASRRLRFMAYAAGLLLAAALAALLAFYQINRQQRAAVAGLEQQLNALQQRCDSVQIYAQSLEEPLEFLGLPATRPVVMKGTALAPDAIATVYYNPETRRSLIGIGRLPAHPSDKQYQLWAITESGEKSMGVLDLPQDGKPFLDVDFIANAKAFALTLENRGGSPAPTLDQMYVLGNNS